MRMPTFAEIKTKTLSKRGHQQSFLQVAERFFVPSAQGWVKQSWTETFSTFLMCKYVSFHLSVFFGNVSQILGDLDTALFINQLETQEMRQVCLKKCWGFLSQVST